VHEITNVETIIVQEFPATNALLPDKETNDAAGVCGPMKKFEGKRTSMEDPISRTVLVVNETVVIPVVVLCAILSLKANMRSIFET
jgi:hypothetical protein